ncbi:MAG: zf-TFIIB domain-containing protein [Planctomycetes bacterium]|nr:zf-TFIIB domain-containing protein [Planctomycetota bacterium]
MEERRLDAVSFERCTACSGLWFDRLEHDALKAVAAAIDDGTARPVATARRSCPHCRVTMLSLADINARDLHYEKCATCGGAFFDRGEFARYTGAGSHLARFLKPLF